MFLGPLFLNYLGPYILLGPKHRTLFCLPYGLWLMVMAALPLTR